MCQELVIAVVAVSGQYKDIFHKDELRVVGQQGKAWQKVRAWRDECALIGVKPVRAIINTSGGEYVGRWDND